MKELHGFTEQYSEALPELNGVLHRYVYDKNGAELVWLERADDNKTFAIAFRTVPSDDTGVFHILEHSVLCGSKKYPVKEPFVDLLKSSLATFLNAFTFPDKTMYPLCSRNDQDFLNLIDVYMDAVFHPLSIEDPHAFRQEGWHYELDDPQGELRINGVVYNEMKGAYTDPLRVAGANVSELLFPDNCYGVESGGHPDHIPELTYEQYLENHRRFYSPSNARIFLDGSVDVDAVFAKISEFLAPYDPIEVDGDIPLQAPVCPPARTVAYEIGAEESEEGKAILARGYVIGRFDERDRTMAFQVLSEYLCGSNEAPLTKALLDKGLCESVDLSTEDGIQQNMAQLTLRNVGAEKTEEAWRTVEETLRREAEALDQKRLGAILARLEFQNREKDFGGFPKGLVFAMQSLETWLYGGDPKMGLLAEGVFARLREKLNDGGFSQYLREMMIDNPHVATVVMLPSKTVGAEKAAREKERLAAIKAAMTPAETEKVMEDFALLRQKQDKEDGPEELATLPKLSLKDIPAQRKTMDTEKMDIGGVPVLFHPADTNGILYLDLFFDASDVPQDKLSDLAIMTSLLGKTATERYGVMELSDALSEKLGAFSAEVFPAAGNDGAKAYVMVSLSLLESRKAEALELLDEILNRTKWTDEGYLVNMVRQLRLQSEQRAMMAGNRVAALHAGASRSAKGAVSEALTGITCLRRLQGMEKTFGPEALAALAAPYGRVFTRERVLLNLTGKREEAWLRDILALLKPGQKGPDAAYAPVPKRADGFSIPSQIGFAARVANLKALNQRTAGAARVASQLLTYDYLWNMVRVKGGAYGTGFRVSFDGDVTITSYRDPNPAQSLQTFLGTGDALADFAAGEGELEKYAVSTIGELDPLLTPRIAGRRAAQLLLEGITAEDLQREWDQVRLVTKADLAAFAQTLKALLKDSGVAVIGGQAGLESCPLDQVEALQ